jgi:hypothetical protein
MIARNVAATQPRKVDKSELGLSLTADGSGVMCRMRAGSMMDFSTRSIRSAFSKRPPTAMFYAASLLFRVQFFSRSFRD